MTNKIYLSVIIPAYNEEKRIGSTLLKIRDYLVRQDYVYEIIIVNDGSTDRTIDVVEEIKLKTANLIIANNKENRGKGFVVRQGMLSARGDYRLFLDADNSSKIEEVENFFTYIKQGHDIIIGSRAIKGAHIIFAQRWQRKFLGNIYYLMAKFLAGLYGFYDTQCGLKIFSAESADKVFSKCHINGFSFDVEALLIAKKFGYSIKEVPINWSDSPGTKVKLKSMLKAVFDLLKIRFNLIFKKYG